MKIIKCTSIILAIIIGLSVNVPKIESGNGRAKLRSWSNEIEWRSGYGNTVIKLNK